MIKRKIAPTELGELVTDIIEEVVDLADAKGYILDVSVVLDPLIGAAAFKLVVLERTRKDQ